MSNKKPGQWDMRCPVCNQLLFRVSVGQSLDVEIKCPGCKTLLQATSNVRYSVDVKVNDKPDNHYQPREFK